MILHGVTVWYILTGEHQIEKKVIHVLTEGHQIETELSLSPQRAPNSKTSCPFLTKGHQIGEGLRHIFTARHQIEKES